MTDPILQALQAHTKEPEEVDWEEKYYFWRGLCELRSQEIARLKDVILRLEQRCAKLEGRRILSQKSKSHEMMHRSGRVKEGDDG